MKCNFFLSSSPLPALLADACLFCFQLQLFVRFFPLHFIVEFCSSQWRVRELHINNHSRGLMLNIINVETRAGSALQLFSRVDGIKRKAKKRKHLSRASLMKELRFMIRCKTVKWTLQLKEMKSAFIFRCKTFECQTELALLFE